MSGPGFAIPQHKVPPSKVPPTFRLKSGAEKEKKRLVAKTRRDPSQKKMPPMMGLTREAPTPTTTKEPRVPVAKTIDRGAAEGMKPVFKKFGIDGKHAPVQKKIADAFNWKNLANPAPSPPDTQ
jgi:hypothetical protein